VPIHVRKLALAYSALARFRSLSTPAAHRPRWGRFTSRAHHRHRRRGFLHRLAVLVKHRAHAPELGTGDDRVTQAQRAFFTSTVATAAAFFPRSIRLPPGSEPLRGALSSSTSAAAGSLRAAVDTSTGARRHADEHVLPATLGNDLVLGQLGAHAVGVRVLLSTLFTATTIGTLAARGVLDGLDGLRITPSSARTTSTTMSLAWRRAHAWR